MTRASENITPRVSADRGLIQVDKGHTALDDTKNDDEASRASQRDPLHTPKASSTYPDSEDVNRSRAPREGSHQAPQPEAQNSRLDPVRGNNPCDHEQTSPEDEPHEEMGLMAWVWKTFLEEGWRALLEEFEEFGPFDLEMAEE
ncbi:hypothetical protein IW261DRAFT_1557389 [Armillaria novae-zelandiae]|uniref:Uncharacterized protein n=1 Tax=Armillaria novae-zelandiae TaxID=153914 RepID=A0AA39PTG6_9AGAR|nr:hypothetical protein IW261DRAFT_1557389 [Armillaria novae-zelandiae]